MSKALRATPVRTAGRLIVLALLLAATWAIVLRPMSPRSGPAPVDLADGWTLGTPAAQGFDDAALRRTIESLLDAPLNIHGVVVERHGTLVAEYYQGGKDRSVYALASTRRSFGPGVRQDIRSVGKSVTSLLYGVALQDGKVPAGSASVLDAYPALADLATPEKRAITVDDLLDMANGLAWNEDEGFLNDELRLYWKGDIPRFVMAHALASAPGTSFHYNGGGTAILADLITQGTGQPLDAFARSRLFEPLGIVDWEWVRDVHGRPMPFNGLRMRPRDLLKIGRLVLNRGRWQGLEIVPAEWISRVLEPRFATPVRDFRYGHQWWAGTVQWQGHAIDWHGGLGNGGQRLYVVPGLDLSIVTTAGAYDETPTAIRVNDLLQQIVDTVQR